MLAIQKTVENRLVMAVEYRKVEIHDKNDVVIAAVTIKQGDKTVVDNKLWRFVLKKSGNEFRIVDIKESDASAERRNSSPKLLGFPEPETVIDEFTKAVNSLDSEKVCSLFTQDSDVSKWVLDIENAKKNSNSKIGLIIKQTKIERQDTHAIITALVSADGDKGFSNNTWIISLVKTDVGFQIEEIHSQTVDEKNNHTTVADKLMHSLIQAKNDKSYVEVSKLFVLSPSDRSKISKGDQSAFSTNNLNWLYTAMNAEKCKLNLYGISCVRETWMLRIKLKAVTSCQNQPFCM